MKLKLHLKISYIFNIILFLVLTFLLFQTQLFRFYPVQELPAEIEKELAINGSMALLSEDVPVGALLTYKDKIIGSGYNTVFRDGNIAGHAEINAINDAIAKIGIEEFLDLDRSKLEIISTFEPCEMCRGALIHYRINNVKFLKDKPSLRWLKSDRAEMMYEIHKKQAGRENTQDSLFLLHPRYPGGD